MTIVYEPYAGNTGTGTTVLPFVARGTDRTGNYGDILMPFSASGTGTEYVHGVGTCVFPLTAFGTDAGNFGRAVLPFEAIGFASGVELPDVGIGSVAMPLWVQAHGFATEHGTGATALPLVLFGSDVTSFGCTSLTLRAYGRDVAPSRFATLYQFPWVQAHISTGVTLAIGDSFHASAVQDADWIHALLELFTMSAQYTQAAQVLQALADGMSLADIAQMIIQSDLLDSFIASGVLAGTAQITVLLADGLEFDEGASALSEILAALHDGFYATITVNTGDDVYTAWVMTTETKAMRSYSNFPFNSYAMLGGQFIGAAKDGIYRMGGNKDAGEAIRWAIRTGQLDFGSLQMKGAPLVYIGATTSGALLLKVTATTIRGQMAEQIYRMTPAVTGEPREHRQQVGRGFRSVYWTFELANDTDGATAEIHEWHAVPVKHTGKLI